MFASGERPLMTNLMEIEHYNRTYLRTIAQMIREGFNAENFTARIQELSDIIREDVYNDPNLLYSLQDFETGLNELINFVEERAAHLDMRLDDFSQKTDLKLNELMTVNINTETDSKGKYKPWVEIYNMGPGLVNTDGLFLTDDSNIPNKWQIPTVDLADGNFLILFSGESNEGLNIIPFSLDSQGGELYLFAYDEFEYKLIDNVSYPALSADVSFGSFPDGGISWYKMIDHTTPSSPNKIDHFPNSLFINEFMADNDITIMNSNGNTPDWIEIFNADNEKIDLSGMYLTDDLSDPTSWKFPEDSYIEPSGYIVVWADGVSDQESLHTNFKLNANGEEIGLFASDGETLIDSVVFLKQIRDVSYGRIPDGSPNWDYLPTSTLGLANQRNSVTLESSVWTILILGLLLIIGIILIFYSKRVSVLGKGDKNAKQ
jgi:hypothetical protein